MPTSDEDYLREAIELAVANVRAGGGPFGALVVREGAVLARGANRVVAGHDPTAHAEIVALRAACQVAGTHHLEGSTLYTSCEPCPMCYGALQWARVARLVYAADRRDAALAGFDDEAFYGEFSAPPAERTLPARRLLAGEGRAPFDAWRDNAARAVY